MILKLTQKYNECNLLKKYFDETYFNKTCNVDYLHQFWKVIDGLNLWGNMENRLSILEQGLKDKNKIKSFFGKNKFQHEEKIYDTFSEIFFSAYFVEKFGDSVDIEKSTNGNKNCDLYIDLRTKEYEGTVLDEYYIEIRTVQDTSTLNSGNQILKGKTLEKLGKRKSDGSIKESQFIDNKKNILLLIDLHHSTRSHDSYGVVHGSADSIIWSESKDENGKLRISVPQINYENNGIRGDEFNRDEKLSLLGHLQSSGKIYHFDHETFRLVPNPSGKKQISKNEQKILFGGTKAKLYTGGIEKIADGNDIFSGKFFNDLEKQFVDELSKIILNS